VNNLFPLLLLAIGGVAGFLWLSPQSADAAESWLLKLKNNVKALGGASGESGTNDPVNIQKIGGDTILPDPSNTVSSLQNLISNIAASGGNVSFESPDFALNVEAPVTVTPVPFPVPIQTSATLDLQGNYLPLDASYVTSSGESTVWNMGVRKWGYKDVYIDARGATWYAFREAGSPTPPLFYDLAGREYIPPGYYRKADGTAGYDPNLIPH
jgi:hypothetical protein